MTEETGTRKPRGPYRPQDERAKRKPPLVIQERDVAIIRAVFENRFLTRALLLGLFPPAPRSGPDSSSPRIVGTNLDRRLAKLFHHGYLDRISPRRGEELVYALGQRGASLLRSLQLELPLSEATDWSERNRDLTQFYVNHALMVARFRVALTFAVPLAPGVELELFTREHRALKAEWRDRGERQVVNPDAFFTLRDGTRAEGKDRAHFLLEADRSTMALGRLLDKFEAYSGMYADRIHEEAFRIPSFAVLTVAKSRERASNLLDLVAGTDSPISTEHRKLFLFTTEEAYVRAFSNVLAAIWRAADRPEELRGIVASPLSRTL